MYDEQTSESNEIIDKNINATAGSTNENILWFVFVSIMCD